MQQQISEHPSVAISKLNDTEIILRKLRFYKLFWEEKSQSHSNRFMAMQRSNDLLKQRKKTRKQFGK